uniref:Vacuolar protein sorting-associated protein 53 homolog n=1 Tax=Meloidogyne javanica TaxID=6303 RepID=A0A915MLE9_MELJA
MPNSSILSVESDLIDETTKKKMTDDNQSVDEFPMFSSKVRALMAQVDDSELIRPDFDLTVYINKLFPTEQSLAQLDVFMKKFDEEIEQCEQDLSKAVAEHGRCAVDANNTLLQAKSMIGELDQKIKEMRGKTRCSEDSVFELTKDIRQLDVAKRNLTESITTLHHLHLLLNGVNSLIQWVSNRQYRDIAIELPAVLNVLILFEDYQHIEHIKNLMEKLQKIREQLSVQLIGDLKSSFSSGQIGSQTTDMCRVMVAVLGGQLQDNFIEWFISQQLGIYGVLYADSEDVAWLDKIEERYRWFVNKLAEYERTGLTRIFPQQWEMGRRLAKEFCSMTRNSLGRMMTRRKSEIDWKLLVHAINHTQMFEQLLTKRFPAKDEYDFEKIIWSVFDEHVDIFLNEQQNKISHFLNECAAKIRSGEERPKKEIHSSAIPLPSATNMFLLIKKIITESTKLFADANNVLSKLIEIFRQCLRQYAHGCLSAFLPQTFSQTSSTLSGVGLIGTSSILQNLIRDETSPSARLTQDQIYFTCCILATADWSAETTVQLQEKLKQKISPADLSQESELFYSISNNSLSILVQDAEMLCEPSLQAMTKINWSNIEQVGDESPYVSTIRKNLRPTVPLIRDYFSERRKYFAHFCMKLATNLVNKFLGAIFKCRPISIAGAEQLLLDTHSLKTFLLNLPSIESSIVIKPLQMYTNTLNKGMARAEMILKAVMADTSDPNEFVTHYMRILPDSDVSELQRILEMRSMRKADQQQLVQLYKTKLESGKGDNQTVTNTKTMSTFETLAGSAGIPSSLASFGDSSMRKLEKLVRKM